MCAVAQATLKMESRSLYEMSLPIYQCRHYHIPKVLTLYKHNTENLNSQNRLQQCELRGHLLVRQFVSELNWDSFA
jgi:hypothetical protein